MRSNPDFVPVVHGKTATNVPLGIFKGRSSVIDRSQVGESRVRAVGGDPWLSPDALDVILAGASRARAEQMEKERKPVKKGRDLVSNGRFTKSIRLLERHLRSCPEDRGTWQVIGEALYQVGRVEEDCRCVSVGRNEHLRTKLH